MNFNMEQWRVQAYTANVYQLSQQRMSRLGPVVRSEVFKGKSEYFDRMGLATAQKKVSRNSPTPNLDITLSRRMVTTSMYEWATLVDRKDKLLQIHDPENQFAQAASMSLGRAMDTVLINSALGNAATGESGATPVALGNGQKVACVSQGAISSLNVATLLQVKQLLDAAETVGPRYLVHNAAQLQSLLNQTQVTSADYNTVRALVHGELDTYLGFKFIHTELIVASSVYSSGTSYDPSTGLYSTAGGALTLAGTEKSAFAFVGDGILLGKNEEAIGRIDERPDYSYAMQVYNSMDFGGVRMEEVKVVEIISAT
jgi:Phage capsid protein